MPELLDTSELELPLDAYLPTLAEIDQASSAHRELIRRCMERFNMRITIPEPPVGPGPKTRNERRYGITSAVAAVKVGYGFEGPKTGTRPTANRPESSLSPAAYAVLTGEGSNLPPGVPKGGCRAEARRQLTPIDSTTRKVLDEDLPQRLSLESFQRSEEDPRVQAAIADWSRCMQDKGYQYKGPFDPLADPKFQPSGGAEERKTAEDDVSCKASTNLIGRWYAVESAYQNALIADHKAELTALAKAQPVIDKLIRSLTRTR